MLHHWDRIFPKIPWDSTCFHQLNQRIFMKFQHNSEILGLVCKAGNSCLAQTLSSLGSAHRPGSVGDGGAITHTEPVASWARILLCPDKNALTPNVLWLLLKKVFRPAIFENSLLGSSCVSFCCRDRRPGCIEYCLLWALDIVISQFCCCRICVCGHIG